MYLAYDKVFCIRRQIGAFRLEAKITEADAAAALARLEFAGFQLEDIQGVLGITMKNWSQEERQIVAGLAHALRRRRLSRKRFETFAKKVRQATARCPGRWEPDVSPHDILKLERPLSFAEPNDPEDD